MPSSDVHHDRLAHLHLDVGARGVRVTGDVGAEEGQDVMPPLAGDVAEIAGEADGGGEAERRRGQPAFSRSPRSRATARSSS